MIPRYVAIESAFALALIAKWKIFWMILVFAQEDIMWSIERRALARNLIESAAEVMDEDMVGDEGVVVYCW